MRPQVHGNVDKGFLWGIEEVTLECGWTEGVSREMMTIKELNNSVTQN